jgi:hypothetical protein
MDRRKIDLSAALLLGNGPASAGEVGIENNNGRNFKDLRGMRGNDKLLKNSNRERKGILIAPLKRPSIFHNHCISFV